MEQLQTEEQSFYLNDISSETADVQYIPCSQLKAERCQLSHKEVTAFMSSLKANGFFDPLEIDGENHIIDGKKRFFAAVRLGMLYVPCVSAESEYKPSYFDTAAAIKDPAAHFFTKAALIRELTEKHLLTQEAAAVLLGSSQSYVANKLRLLRFSPYQMKLIADSELTERHARSLLRIKNSELRTVAICHIRDSCLNVAAADEYIDSLMTHSGDADSATDTSRKLRAACKAVDKLSGTASDLGVFLKINRSEDSTAVNYTIKIYK